MIIYQSYFTLDCFGMKKKCTIVKLYSNFRIYRDSFCTAVSIHKWVMKKRHVRTQSVDYRLCIIYRRLKDPKNIRHSFFGETVKYRFICNNMLNFRLPILLYLNYEFYLKMYIFLILQDLWLLKFLIFIFKLGDT